MTCFILFLILFEKLRKNKLKFSNLGSWDPGESRKKKCVNAQDVGWMEETVTNKGSEQQLYWSLPGDPKIDKKHINQRINLALNQLSECRDAEETQFGDLQRSSAII